MTSIPPWSLNQPPTVKPDDRQYNPSAWKFYATLMIGETLEEWMGRDWELRCIADGHTKGIPRNTGIDGNGVRKSINARFAKTGHPHQITEDKIKSTLAGGASLDCVQIMEITGQNLEVTRRGLRRMELAGAVSVIRVGPSSKKVFTLVRRAGRKTGGAV